MKKKLKQTRAPMLESTAWLILAEKFERTADRYSEFLCINLKHNRAVSRAIPETTRFAMVNRIKDALDPENDGVAYFYDGDGNMIPDAEARAARVMACLLFSEIAADEESVNFADDTV